MTTDIIESQARVGGLPAVAAASTSALRVKRILDVGLALVAIVLVAPICLIVALIIKATSGGQVFFRQRRVGRGGTTFTLIKFRTMTVGTHEEVMADATQRQHYEDNGFKLPASDPRITTAGRLLRKSSLDELPQLVNVLLGHMSLVGIRPLLPVELERRDAEDQTLYRSMRPGMTGLWQVEGRSSVGRADRLALDRRYVQDWSLVLDLAILARTPLAVANLHRTH